MRRRELERVFSDVATGCGGWDEADHRHFVALSDQYLRAGLPQFTPVRMNEKGAG